MKWKAMVAQLANRINQPHVIDLYMRQVFEAGKQHAYNHPAWRMCKDGLPDRGGWYNVVQIDIYGLCEVMPAQYNHSWQRWENEYFEEIKEEVLAWLPLPKFNPKQETRQ